MSMIKRVVLREEAFLADRTPAPWNRGRLDAKFIDDPNRDAEAHFSVFRLEIKVESQATYRIHVSADERYQLFLNGELAGMGPERCDAEFWFYETFDLQLDPGFHSLSAVVWTLGDSHAPYAQHMIKPGFLCIADDPNFKSKITTGYAPWKCQKVEGIEMIKRTSTFATGDRFRFKTGDLIHAAIHGEGDWYDPIFSETPYVSGADDQFPIRTMSAAWLPEQFSRAWKHFVIRNVAAVASENTNSIPVRSADDLKAEHGDWEKFLKGGEITLPANTKRRIIVDCEEYVCSYWHFLTSGGKGSQIRIHWQECLYQDPKKNLKGNRNELEGKYFAMVWGGGLGYGDTIHPQGGGAEHYWPFWFLSGRYMEIYVETADEPLTIRDFRIDESRYPLEPSTAPFSCSDPKLNRISEICLRTLQADLHETFCDSPYYEQLQYVGDTRIEAKMTMMLGDDHLAAKKATKFYQWSIGSRGITQSRYPCRNRQFIPPFSLWWVLMVHDQHLHRKQYEFIQDLMPGVRTVLSAFERMVDKAPASSTFGLMKCGEHWNFLDWIGEWDAGIPPGANDGFNLAINLQLLLAVEAAATLESDLGYAQSQRHYLVWATELRRAIKSFVNSDGLLPDGPSHPTVCEHTHLLAILSNDPELRRIGARWFELNPAGPRATYYFQFYRFEALARLGKFEEILANIRKEWGQMVDSGLVCTLEQPDPSRSDCHAWAAHPLYFFQTIVLGLTPQDAERYEFIPRLLDLDWAEGSVHTGHGAIHVRIDRKGAAWVATMVIPDGITISIPAVKGMVTGPKTVTIDPTA
jgi:alpha-L-rhamnosidase